MKIIVATIEWGSDGDEIEVLASTTAAGARRQALVRLAEISAARSDMSEAQPLFESRPMSPELAESLDDYLVLQYLAAMHEIATVPWVEISEVVLKNAYDSNTEDEVALGHWPQVDLTEYGL
jgi:hypothetical protein